jgi:PAS domain S-box-containing protein
MYKSINKIAESNNFNKISRPLIASTIIIVFVIIVLGILNFYHTQANLSKDAFRNLENISNSKISSINYWRKDKLDDARLLMNDLSHRDLLVNYEKGNSSEKQVLNWLKSLLIYDDITEFILYDTKKVPLIYTEKKEYILEKERIAAFDKCIQTKDVVMSDFYSEENGTGIRIAIFIPVFKSSSDKNEIVKILMIDFDPGKRLQLFIKEWPIQTESSEAYLLRDDGKNVVFLTEVKGLNKSALNLKIPKTDTGFISVKASNGLRGSFRGYDLPGKDIHVFIKDIPETNWILITKTDTDEIKSETMVTSGYIILITIVIIVLALLITYIFNRRNKEQFFKELYKNELQKNIQLERFNILLNNAYDSIILYDSKGNILEANASALEQYGYTLEEMKDLNISNIRAPEERANIQDVISSIHLSDGMMIETYHQTKSGKVFPVEVSASRIEFGGNTYIQGISRDISSRKEYENKLIASEEKFKSVFTYANDVMFIMDGMNFIAANKNAESLFGYKTEELYRMTPIEISPEFQEDGKRSEEKSKAYIDKALNGEPQFFEWIHKNSDGAEFPTEVSLNAINLDGKNYVFAVLRDITFRKIIDKTLKDKEKSLELALDSSELGYYDINFLTGQVVYNKSILQMLGYENDSSRKDRAWWMNLVHPDDIENTEKLWQEYINGKTELYNVEARMRSKDGSYKWILDKCKMFEVTPDGKPIRMVGTHMDISQRKAFEEAILAAKEAAEESNNLKSNFLTNMSHELRTPLTGILGFSELLSSELENEEQKEMADLILKGGKRLTNTLNSILDLSRLESNQLSVSKSIINLVNIIEELKDSYEKAATAKGISMSLVTNCESVCCNLDEKMTYDIINNLLQNATTYTNKGSIAVKLDIVNSDEGDFARVSVKDTGIGINPKFHKQIFEPFRQASEGLSRKFEGTGLGLTLTRKYTEMMGGSISLISNEGKGSEFIVKFPLISCVYKPEPVQESYSDKDTKNGSKINAIFIEDEIENFELLDMLLKPYMNLQNFTSSIEAIEEVKKNHYDIIFMDIGLKDINGMEATKIIRKLNKYKKTPIIAITAFAMQGDKEKILASGCDEYISKPFTKEQLYGVLRKYKYLEDI